MSIVSVSVKIFPFIKISYYHVNQFKFSKPVLLYLTYSFINSNRIITDIVPKNYSLIINVP